MEREIIMRLVHVISYLFLGLNQYRLTMALNENTALMDQLNNKLIENEDRYNILQKNYTLLQKKYDLLGHYVKPNDGITTFLENHETLCLVLGLCGVLVLIYIGTQCTPSIVQGTDNLYKNINEGTKNIGEATVGAINRFSGALDTDHIEKIIAIDPHGTAITLKPILVLDGSNSSCIGLYIRPLNCDQDIFIENISEFYQSHLGMQDLIMPKLDSETVIKRFADVFFDL